MKSSADNTTQVCFREIDISYGRKRKQPGIRSASCVARFLRSIAPNNSQEHFIAIYLDASHAPVGYSVVSTGIANACPVHPREVYQRAIMLGAHCVIVAHNHPSDDPTPSDEDRKITKQLKDAGALLQVRLLDHVIFTDLGGYFSFQEAGEI